MKRFLLLLLLAAPAHADGPYAMAGGAFHAADSGVALVVGYRHRMKLDVAASAVTVGGDGRGATTLAMRAQALHLDSTTGFYAGGGLGYARTEYRMDDHRERGHGVRFEATLGMKLARHFYLEGNLALPLFEIGDRYPAAFVAWIGAGW